MMSMNTRMLIWNVSKTFSEQTFTKHCHQMLFKYFMYAFYHTFNDECLENVSSITLTILQMLKNICNQTPVSLFMLQIFHKCYQQKHLHRGYL